MRPASLLLSLAVAAAALVLPAAARINYYKGLTTVDDLETLRVVDGESTCILPVCGRSHLSMHRSIDQSMTEFDQPVDRPYATHTGRFLKHTLVAFTVPDTDGSAACALDQLEALRFPHVFFHLSGTIFGMIQVGAST